METQVVTAEEYFAMSDSPKIIRTIGDLLVVEVLPQRSGKETPDHEQENDQETPRDQARRAPT